MVSSARSDNAAPSSSRFLQVGFIEHVGRRCRLFHGSWASQEIELPFGVTTTYGRMDLHDRR